MAVSGTSNTYDVTAVPAGATVRYSFTIGSSTGGATDTAWSQLTMTGAAGGGGSFRARTVLFSVAWLALVVFAVVVLEPAL